ncbi:hypothetical protein [Aliikangiella coralliicola]|uniref:Uncharacterized protein n=1 Tax=Aliikangiella coralliicola TaxID=2592383 RepID=A0A545UC17_9GAMM|nr:hypothetical protein [Aliikangiella coralliicola]TQV87006.1 hypothetical protein FLL46_14460 [Aliikangiella coralliicola]
MKIKSLIGILIISWLSLTIQATNKGQPAAQSVLADTSEISAPQLFKPIKKDLKRNIPAFRYFEGDYEYRTELASSYSEQLLAQFETIYEGLKEREVHTEIADLASSHINLRDSDGIRLGIDLNFDVGNVLSKNTKVIQISKHTIPYIIDGFDHLNDSKDTGVYTEKDYDTYMIEFLRSPDDESDWLSINKHFLKGAVKTKHYKIEFYSEKDKNTVQVAVQAHSTKRLPRKLPSVSDVANNPSEIAAHRAAHPELYIKNPESEKRAKEILKKFKNSKKKQK